MKRLKVAINGTGRIGLCACRILGERDDIELIALNTTTTIDILTHLLRYDSVHGVYGPVEQIADNYLKIGKQDNVRILSDRNPASLNFGSFGVKVVIECTGAFKSVDKASLHLSGSVQKVIVSSPMNDAATFVYGVNHEQYQGELVISNASCTTNALAPLVKILHEEYTINNGLMTTIHSYTNDQNLLDVKHKDVRRARAAGLNIIPTSTGAAKAIGLVLPELAGKINGFSVRVPTPNVSLIDFNFETKSAICKESINALIKHKSLNEYAHIVMLDDEKRVSSDFIGCRLSCVMIPDCTIVVGNKNAKVVAWYDNEVGYTARLIDMTCFIGRDLYEL